MPSSRPPSPEVEPRSPEVERLLARRRFITRAAAGTVLTALGGGLYRIVEDLLCGEALAQTRGDGRLRVPPGQRVLERLKPMGGEEGDPSTASFGLRVHGDVEEPFSLDWTGLLAMPQTTLKSDVHCVTGWSVLDAEWSGVTLRALADRARPSRSARHVIFEGAHGYTANVPLREALGPTVMVAHRLGGKPLAATHGAPVRGVVPDLYFWKSAKWLTGIRFVARDAPGYWERRGYHNHGDPWREERYG
ncbi:MAG: molybdopterin-dependent oxidoreductase [Deltaproteobacteria bacterium]|nr:molybdopterin-dependent oxidoreductase [Deltaproteobacteria bacterium]